MKKRRQHIQYRILFLYFLKFHFVCAESYTGVAVWKWVANDDNCGICRMAFDSCCSDCKYPGDDCNADIIFELFYK